MTRTVFWWRAESLDYFHLLCFIDLFIIGTVRCYNRQSLFYSQRFNAISIPFSIFIFVFLFFTVYFFNIHRLNCNFFILLKLFFGEHLFYLFFDLLLFLHCDVADGESSLNLNLLGLAVEHLWFDWNVSRAIRQHKAEKQQPPRDDL